MKKLLQPVMHRFEYVLLLAAGYILRAFPFSVTYCVANVLGTLAFDVVPIRRKVTMNNLRLALGDTYTERELTGIARQAYRSIALTFLELLHIPVFIGRMDEIMDLSGIGIANRLIAKGRGLLVVSAHFGNWELCGESITLAGIPMNAVARSQTNPYVNRLINRYRKSFGINVIALGAPIKHIVRALHKGEAVGLISDQDARHRGIFVNFFGRRASTPVGAAQLALKYKAPIVLVMGLRLKPGKYKTLFEEIKVREDDTVESLTQRYTTAIENVIRQHPDQYFWMHKRWKTSGDSVKKT